MFLLNIRTTGLLITPEAEHKEYNKDGTDVQETWNIITTR
jgi:hypothetical protein